MATVEPLRLLAVEPVHPDREVSIGSLDHEVIVVCNEAVGMAPPRQARDYSFKGAEEEDSIAIVYEDFLTAIPAGGDVVDTARYEESWATRHSKSMPSPSGRRSELAWTEAKVASFRDMPGSGPVVSEMAGAGLPLDSGEIS
jgi:hypothetical protein